MSAILIVFAIVIVGAVQFLFFGAGTGVSTISSVTHTLQADFEAGTVGDTLDTNTSSGDVLLSKQIRETTTEAQFAKGLTFDPFNGTDVSNTAGGEVIIGKSFTYNGSEGPAIANDSYNSLWFDENNGYLYAGSSNNGLYVIDTNGTAAPEDDILVTNYSTGTIPALESDLVECVFTDPTSQYIYICNNGKLEVIDTVGDDIAITYSSISVPPIVGDFVQEAYLDPVTNYLYIQSWFFGVSVIDTDGTPGDADTLLTDYTDGDLLPSNLVTDVLADSANDRLFIGSLDGTHVIDFGADGAPGGADDTLANTYAYGGTGPDRDIQFMGDDLIAQDSDSVRVYDFNGTLENFADDSVSLIDEDSISSIRGRVRGLKYDSLGEQLFISTESTVYIYEPIGGTITDSFSLYSSPHTTSGEIANLAYDTVNGILFGADEGPFGGVHTLQFNDYNLNGEYRGAPIDVTSFSYEALSQTSALGVGDSSSIETRGGAADAYWIDDFDDTDTANISDLGWGNYWDSITESNGILTMTEPNGSDIYPSIDTGKIADFFPVGSVIKTRIKLTADSNNTFLYMYYDDWDSGQVISTNNGEWHVLTYPVTSDNELDFSKIGFEIWWPDNDQLATDKLEIDWISVTKPDSDPDWDAWSALDVDGGILSDLAGDSWLQYRLLLENADSADSPSVGSVTIQKPEYATGGVVESFVIDAGESVDWQEFASTTVEPADTYISFWTRSGDVALPDGTWSEWRRATSVVRSPDSQYLQWKAELATDDLSVTPTLSDVTVSYFTPSVNPDITSIDFSDSADFTREDVRDTAVPAVAQFEDYDSGNGVLLDGLGGLVDLTASSIKPGCRIDIGGEEFIIGSVYNDVTDSLADGYAWISVTQEGLMPNEVGGAVPDGVSDVSYIYCTDIEGEVRLGGNNYIVEEIIMQDESSNGREEIILDPVSGNAVALYANFAYIIDTATSALSGPYDICETGVDLFYKAVYDSFDNEIWFTCHMGPTATINRISPITGDVTLGPIDTTDDKFEINYLPPTNQVLVYGDDTGNIRYYNATTGAFDGVVGFGEDLKAVDYDSNRDLLWMLSSEVDDLILTDIDADTDIKQFTLPDPGVFSVYNFILYDAQTDIVWVADTDFDVLGVNAENGEILTTYALPNSFSSFALFEEQNALAVIEDQGDGMFLIDRTSFEVEGLPYAMGWCGEDVVVTGDELWVMGCSPRGVYHFIPAGVPANQFYTTITTDTTQLGGTGTGGIESHAVVENVSSDVFYAVSFDGRDSFKVFTGGAWRVIASNKASDHGGTEGVWYSRDNADTWTEALADNANRAISESVAAGVNNQMDGVAFSALTELQWMSSGGWQAGNTFDLAVALRADDITDDPTVSNFEIEFSPQLSGGPNIVQQPLASSITLLTPNGTEEYIQGDVVNVVWSSNSNVPFVNLYYSTDFGNTYITIASNVSGTGGYSWTVPKISADRVLMKIEASDLVTVLASDLSDGTFKISPPLGEVNPFIILNEIVSALEPETVATIRWQGAGNFSFVKLYYSLADGGSKYLIAENIPNTGEYNWFVPNAQTNNAKLYIESQDTGIIAVLDETEYFTIAGTVPVEEFVDTHAIEVSATLDRVSKLPVPVHSLIKIADDRNSNTSDDTTVYYIGADGYRHAFPHYKVYFSWYCDFSDLQVVNAETVNSIQTGRDVTFRPGKRLVKFYDSNRVYAVEYPNILRHIINETVASQLYGSAWGNNVEEVSVEFIQSYKIGNEIVQAGDYSHVASIFTAYYPSDVLQVAGSTMSIPAERRTSCIQ
ncbi:TPA: hypothetical protein DCZ32_03700 [Candidatus Uhrbacteria bacterium]|nr:hypothetical protein [Candidatus Uhrbacteria bacterium]